MGRMKKWRGLLCAAIVAGAAAGSALAATSTAPADVSIPFANRGGIRDWQADHDRGLWVQDVHRKWYYAKFMGPCMGLPFAQTIAFDTRPIGTFDKFSAIIVPGSGRCVVQSLVASGAPKVRTRPAPAEAPAREPKSK
jgi:hypothetical protein